MNQTCLVHILKVTYGCVKSLKFTIRFKIQTVFIFCTNCKHPFEKENIFLKRVTTFTFTLSPFTGSGVNVTGR